jgi:hypothetical protein
VAALAPADMPMLVAAIAVEEGITAVTAAVTAIAAMVTAGAEGTAGDATVGATRVMDGDGAVGDLVLAGPIIGAIRTATDTAIRIPPTRILRIRARKATTARRTMDMMEMATTRHPRMVLLRRTLDRILTTIRHGRGGLHRRHQVPTTMGTATRTTI